MAVTPEIPVRDDIHLVAIHPDDGTVIGRWFDDDSISAQNWAMARNDAGLNVYWTVNVVRPGLDAKPTKLDIMGIRFAHVDIDPPFAAGSKAAEFARLMSCPTPPDLIIDSGNGLQGLWELDEDDDTLHVEVEECNRRLIEYFETGSGTWNIDRLFRLPGTLNYPPATKRAKGRTVVPSRVLYRS